jgi:hypothetical protein
MCHFVFQTLALYDRFGRLMYGSEELIKDVLEYVVFEKHISDIYGLWRVHAQGEHANHYTYEAAVNSSIKISQYFILQKK